MDYLTAAKGAMNFIDTRKKKGPEGIYWSLEDAAKGRPIYYDEICMYAGASGIICFLLGLYDATKENQYLEEAKEAADYIIWRWKNEPELKRNFSKYAFSSGWSGAGFALTRLYLVTKEEKYKDTVAAIIAQMKKDAKPGKNGQGYSWSTFPGIVGDGGTVLFLLFAADVYQDEDWKNFGITAGRNFLGQRQDAGEGKCWYPGVDPAYFGAKSDYIDPNFPMGTAGVGFVLRKLYEASGNEVYLQAEQGITGFMDSVAVKMRVGKLLPHGLPDRKNLFYLGYCHGPAGTVRYYYKLYEGSRDEQEKAKYKEKIRTLVQGLEATGAPEGRSEGYWNTHNLCCGTAGLLNMYLGLWAAFGEAHDLELAKRCGRILLDAAEVEKEQEPLLKWRFALDRIAPDVLTTPIGCFDGAAGIGLALLQLHLAETDQYHVTRFLDDPFPDEKVIKA